MSREEEIAKIDAELEKIGEKPESTEEEVEETEEEGDSETPAKEEPKDEPKEEVKSEVKLEINTDLPAATLGYKLREADREKQALKKELEDLKKPKVAKEENYEGYIEGEIGVTKQEIAELKQWKKEQEQAKQEEQEREGAFRELRTYESEAANAFPDFPDASNYAKSMIAASIKLLEPTIQPEELAQKTLYKYAEHAALALNSKKHPGQAIYEMAHTWGYKKKEAESERPQIEVKQDNKATLATLEKNKKKSTGMSNNGGNGKAFMTNDELTKMTNAERMKLTPSDWERLEQESA